MGALSSHIGRIEELKMELTGKNVFISGSSRGIGASMAVLFAKKGLMLLLTLVKMFQVNYLMN